MRIIKPLFKYLLYIIGSFISLILLYLAAAWILTIIPANNNFTETKNGITIFVKSNGVHTDIVVPIKSDLMDWTKKFNMNDFKPPQDEFKYIAFGWGDKGFYLHTPTWGDLKASTAFNALFWLGTSAMHVTCYEYTPTPGERTRKITISEEEYKKIVAFIDDSFAKDKEGNYQLINNYHYENVNDNFYEGNGVYSLLRTCNCWTNEGLKVSGIKTAQWAPFEACIMYHRPH